MKGVLTNHQPSLETVLKFWLRGIVYRVSKLRPLFFLLVRLTITHNFPWAQVETNPYEIWDTSCRPKIRTFTAKFKNAYLGDLYYKINETIPGSKNNAHMLHYFIYSKTVKL